MTDTPDTRPSQGTPLATVSPPWQRRSRVDFMVPAELAIRAAINEVEQMPADTRLTDAVTLLGHAKDRVADYVDGVTAPGPHALAIDEYRQQIAAQAERIATLETDAAEAERISDYTQAVLVANVTERERLQRDLSVAIADVGNARVELNRHADMLAERDRQIATLLQGIDQERRKVRDKAQPMEWDVEWMVHGNGDVLFFSDEKKARAEAQKLTTLTHDVSLHRSQFVAVCRGRHVWSDMVSP